MSSTDRIRNATSYGWHFLCLPPCGSKGIILHLEKTSLQILLRFIVYWIIQSKCYLCIIFSKHTVNVIVTIDRNHFASPDCPLFYETTPLKNLI